jgi:hypothetical protein
MKYTKILLVAIMLVSATGCQILTGGDRNISKTGETTAGTANNIFTVQGTSYRSLDDAYGFARSKAAAHCEAEAKKPAVKSYVSDSGFTKKITYTFSCYGHYDNSEQAQNARNKAESLQQIWEQESLKRENMKAIQKSNNKSTDWTQINSDSQSDQE